LSAQAQILPRLADKAAYAFNRDGTVKDLAAPDPRAVCFVEMAGTLSRINRFNGWADGIGYSDAQHCVMGAQAIRNEGGSHLESALFLLHDGHEWAIGDMTRPYEQLLAAVLPSLAIREAIASIKAGWDEAIYLAAELPPPSRWTAAQAKRIKAMDDRMCAAEAVALFGPRALRQFPPFTPPKTTGAIRPWGAAKAEEAFLTELKNLIGDAPVARQQAFATQRAMR
jgi:hypothetical protein